MIPLSPSCPTLSNDGSSIYNTNEVRNLIHRHHYQQQQRRHQQPTLLQGKEVEGVVNEEPQKQQGLLLVRDQHTRTLLFVKILLQYLEKNTKKGDNYDDLIVKVKAIVKTCVQRNRLRDERFLRLSDVVDMTLQEVVGDTIWNQVKLYSRHYHQLNNMRRKKKKEMNRHQQQHQEEMSDCCKSLVQQGAKMVEPVRS